LSSTIATLSDWHAEEGWGVLQSSETGGGCWFLFDSLVNMSVEDLKVGCSYVVDFEAVEQDGYQYRALTVSPVPGQGNRSIGRPEADGVAFRSTLRLNFGL
jgi:CspA family cold shock protein